MKVMMERERKREIGKKRRIKEDPVMIHRRSRGGRPRHLITV